MDLQKSHYVMFRVAQDLCRRMVAGTGRWSPGWVLTGLLYLGALLPILLWAKDLSGGASGLVSQEIRYRMPEAGEVWLVWGVNGWAVVPEAIRPPGTVVKKAVLHTPMKPQDQAFVVRLQVPAGTTLDYGFLITKGKNGFETEVWEADGTQDFHTVVTPGTVIEVESGLPQFLESGLVSQEIRYRMPEAGEVWLVWGVNGWAVVPEAIRPPGTVLKGKLMYTPMAYTQGAFVVRVQVLPETLLDYAFQITKRRDGATIDVWDTNAEPHRDYHTVAQAGGRAEVQATAALRQMSQAKASPRDFDAGFSLLLGAGLVLACSLLLNRLLGLRSSRPFDYPTRYVLGMGLCLCLFLLPLRATILGFAWISPQISFRLVPEIFFAGYYDIVYVITITLFFLGLLFIVRNRQSIQRVLCFVYIGFALGSLLLALLNTKAVEILGHGFSYQLLYYSGFLRSPDATVAIRASISQSLILNGITLCLAVLIASYSLSYSMNSVFQRQIRRVFILSGVGFLLLYCPMAKWYIQRAQWEYEKIANPITVFVQSIIASYSFPPLFTIPTQVKFDDFSVSPKKFAEDEPRLTPTNEAVQNVVLIVLESVSAEYLDLYGGPYPVTPTLSRYSHQALLFDNIYTHAPATNKALISILCSTYPWISYQSLTAEYPAISLPSLSATLKEHGYRTAFFNAADSRFQRIDLFLSHRQFDKSVDSRSLRCQGQDFPGSSDNPYLGGVDDRCLVDAFTEWVYYDSGQPFFAMLWTYTTHYPYYVIDEEIDFGVQKNMLNRYLNTILYSDKVVAELLHALERRALLESTLVVLVGDHGEAFGQHGSGGHASEIYEENVHVPLMMINPELFKGERDPVMGGSVDVAPTILDLLRLPAPKEWQGRSLFDRHRSGRVYFFSPWWDFLLGYREADLKVIFNATNNMKEIYNLRDDPGETTNVADQMPEFSAESHQRLAAWVQYQDKFMRGFLQ